MHPRKDQAAGLEVRGLRKEEARTTGELRQRGADPQVVTIQRPILLRGGSTRSVLERGTVGLHEEQLRGSMELKKGSRVVDLELRMQEVVDRSPQETGGSPISRLYLCGIGQGT